MKHFVIMFIAIVVLAAGFTLGVRYQERVESRSAMHALVEVQKIKIDRLQENAMRLRTALLLRDYLEEVRVRLPRSTYQTITDGIADASIRFGVPPETILAVIRIESRFDVNAESDAGAIGLMQVLPSTAEEVARELRMEWPGDALLRDPAANIRIGTYYLTKMLAQFNDLALALSAYNEGPARTAERAVDRGGAPTLYSQKVLSYAAP
jgi:soluble lytic murein transglycosylase-like protein